MDTKTISSIISPMYIEALLQSAYNIGKIVNCELVQSTINDTYKIETLNKKYMLKIYNKNKNLHEINFETSFVNYLKSKNIGVAKYIQKIDENFILNINASEGLRYGILTEFINGHESDYTIKENAFLYGRNVAKLHQEGEFFSTNEKIKKININLMLEKSIYSIENFLQKHYINELEVFKTFFNFLLQRLENIEINDLEQVFCHGDLHGGNAFIKSKKINFFDFEFCGYGLTLYDISVFRWGCIIGKREWQWQNFINGYKTIRNLDDKELVNSLIFVAIRDLWVMHLYIMRTATEGSSFVNKYYIKNRIKFIKEMESQILK
jgi:Ser/Thr protein kinase RdoA (MazF antagonist)